MRGLTCSSEPWQMRWKGMNDNEPMTLKVSKREHFTTWHRFASNGLTLQHLFETFRVYLIHITLQHVLEMTVCWLARQRNTIKCVGRTPSIRSIRQP